MPALLAQIEPTPLTPAEVVAFIILTLALLALAYAVLWLVRSYEAKLILLGLLVAVAAIGYGTMIGGGVVLAGTLMRIGVILVLGGLAISLLSYLSGKPPAETPEVPPITAPRPEEPRHEP